ncbi:MAG: 50S ribosomal protein L29 [Candidatus Gottesmanbacteria bacterium]|nr:50S ribosomal protein L29 [Candidatus Gottesmanbacteria bacterium]
MKKKEKQSLRAMSDAELVKQIQTLETEMLKGRVERKTKQMKNLRLYRTKRTVVAVSKTIMRERELSLVS